MANRYALLSMSLRKHMDESDSTRKEQHLKLIHQLYTVFSEESSGPTGHYLTERLNEIELDRKVISEHKEHYAAWHYGLSRVPKDRLHELPVISDTAPQLPAVDVGIPIPLVWARKAKAI
jgi:hypothetical protein